tara:strand:+ start:4514 stop:4897 length:384 start_codon:yes stop_codon:yes gene_type:complete
MAIAGSKEAEYRYGGTGATYTHTATAAIAAGEVLLVNGIIMIALDVAAASGDIIEMAFDGVWEITCNTGDDFGAGEDVYWDVSANEIVNNAGAGTNDPLIGHTMEDSAASATSVLVRINEQIVTLHA